MEIDKVTKREGGHIDQKAIFSRSLHLHSNEAAQFNSICLFYSNFKFYFGESIFNNLAEMYANVLKGTL